MNQYFVYILLCSDNSYYTGVTNNLERRLTEHQVGESVTCYTYQRRPVKLVFSAEFNSIDQAIAFEKQVKGWSRKKKEAIINDNWDLLPELSRRKDVAKQAFARPSTMLRMTAGASIETKRSVMLSFVETRAGASPSYVFRRSEAFAGPSTMLRVSSCAPLAT